MADSSHQQTQAGLLVLVEQDLQGIYPHINTADLEQELPRLTLLVQAVTTKYGKVSGALSGRFYQQQRIAAGLGNHSARVAPVPSPEQVAKTLGWATHDKSGDVLDFGAAQRRIEAGAAKLVQDVGRRTVIDSVAADPQGRGWARVTEPDPCYFCALLASRGGVYTKASGSFQSHDDCRCHAVPEFTAHTPQIAAALAQGRQWAQDYAEATQNRKDGQSLLNAWRHHYDANVRPAAQAAA